MSTRFKWTLIKITILISKLLDFFIISPMLNNNNYIFKKLSRPFPIGCIHCYKTKRIPSVPHKHNMFILIFKW